jgi:hypothetical protein
MVRLKYVSRLATATESWFADANLIAIWSAIEPGLGIMASSLATLRPLFRSCLGITRTLGGSSISPNSNYARFPILKAGATIEEAPVRKDELSMADFRLMNGNFEMKGSTAVHHHIPKEPWKPGGTDSTPNSPLFDRPDTAKLQNQRSLVKAEELLGETFSSYPSPRYGNVVRCEGPDDDIQAQPRRSNSALRGLYKR